MVLLLCHHNRKACLKPIYRFTVLEGLSVHIHILMYVSYIRTIYMYVVIFNGLKLSNVLNKLAFKLTSKNMHTKFKIEKTVLMVCTYVIVF